MVRFILIAIIIFFGLIFMSDSIRLKKRNKLYIVFISIILILQSGLRHIYVGPDTFQYYKIFEHVKSMSWDEILTNLLNNNGKDPFYYVFQKIFQLFIVDYQIYLFFVASLFFISFAYFIYKNTYSVLEILLAYILYICNFYIFFSITGIRQTIATSFILFSFEFIKRKRFFLFIILVFIASLFHISALIFIIAYPIVNFFNLKKFYFLSLILFVITFLVKSEFASFLISLTDTGDRFDQYLDDNSTSGSFFLTAANYLLGIIAYLLLNKTIKKYKSSNLLFSIFALSLIFFPLQWLNSNAMRIAQYFNISMVALLPLILSSTTNILKYKFALYFFSILLFLGMLLYSAENSGEYKFFWQDMELPANYK